MVKWLIGFAFLASFLLGFAGATQPHAGEGAPAWPSAGAIACEGIEIERPDPLHDDPLRPETVRREGDLYVADRESGAIAELTLDPRLQAATERLLQRGQIKYGASVMISIHDGRVLALAGRAARAARAEKEPTVSGTDLALRSWAPAASIFKLVSAAALVDEAGLSGESRACYHGGMSSVRRDNLVDYPRLDRCASLAYGIGKSQNAILAKLAVRNLSPEQLARTGRAMGFGEAMDFDLPVEPSHLDVPEGDPLEFARAAAGFWHSTLSPLHGAVLAAAIADGGRMVTPYLVERPHAGVAAPTALATPAAEESAAADDESAAAPTARQVMSPEAAAEVAGMMAGVTRMGTARSAFHDRHGRSRLPFLAAGKTGTLYGKAVGYSWFVGFAPIEHPTVAFAVALANKPGSRLRAADVARELLAEYAAGSEAPISVGAPPRLARHRHAGRVGVARRG